MSLNELAVDTTAHAKDGLLLHARDGDQMVDIFISRRVLDRWANQGQVFGDRRSFLVEEYNKLGARNLDAIGRLADKKYGLGIEFNRQHPFVDILYSDIVDGEESLLGPEQAPAR